MKNPKRILLISPNITGTKGGVNRIQYGLGIGYIAAILRKNNHIVEVLDSALEGWENETELTKHNAVSIGLSDSCIGDKVRAFSPDIVGISVLFSNLLPHTLKIASLLKKINPNIKVVVGGNHVTNASRIGEYSFIESENVDFAISGECDYTFLQFVEDVPVKTIFGMMFMEKNKLFVNKQKSYVDIKTLPHPSWDLFNMEKYFKVGRFHSSHSLSKRVMSVMASRGCPEKCTFCSTPETWGSKVRWRDPYDIYSEMKKGKEEFNFGEIQFQDDTLTANKKHLLKLCSYLEKIGLPWCTPNGIKVNYHTKDHSLMFKRMKESGCYQVTLACESGSQDILDNVINKNLRLEQIKPAIKAAKEAGLIVHTFWIVGFPGEKFKQMEETVRFAAGSGADSFSLSVLNPLPGTPIYNTVNKNNLWWETPDIHFVSQRNSLIKVDGFDSADQFETWVDEQNFYLNSLLEKHDHTRAELVRKNRGPTLMSEADLKLHQT